MAEKWMIWVSDYGTFEFEGTDQEAEHMRVTITRSALAEKGL